MSDVPTDTNIGAVKINQPRMSDPSSGASLVPPGMGELNYIQTILAGVLDQTLYTSSSPTFVGLTLTGLTASALVGTDASQALTSLTVGTSLSLAAGTLNAIQGIRTADSPSFTGLTVSGLTVSVPVVTNASKALASVTYATFKTSLAIAQADVSGLTTGASPTFVGLTLSGLTGSEPVVTSAGKALASVSYSTFKSSLSLSATDVSLGNLTNDKQVKGLVAGTTSGHIVTWGADGYTVADAGAAPHAAVTVSAPIALSTQALSLVNNAVSPGTITAIDIGTLANSDTVVPTSKAVVTAIAAGGAMVYPGAGVPVSTGAAWGTSVTNDVSNARKFLRELSVAGVFTTPVWDTLLAADIPDISATYQPKSANLTTYAGIAPSANAQTLLGETFAQMLASIGAQAAGSYQPLSSNLTTYAGVAPSANAQTLLGETFAQMLASIGAQATLTRPVLGPATNSDGYIPQWDGANGLLLKNGIPISANGQSLINDTYAQMLTAIGAAPAFTSGTANYFWATPNGGAGVPSLRAIVAADIPTLNQDTTGKAGNLAFGSDAQDDIAVRGATVYGRLAITEQTLVGRITAGHVAALSASQVKTLLAIAQADVAGLTTADSPTHAGLTVGTLAGIVKAAAGVLSAQALGAANLKLFMNAAANGIEWAAGMYTGSFTYDISTTGAASVTGVGFKPSWGIFFGSIDSTYTVSIGIIAGSTNLCFTQNAAGVWTYAARAWYLSTPAGVAYINTPIVYDTDGFTYTKVKSVAPTGTAQIYYLLGR